MSAVESETKARMATETDMSTIYMMGFDVWGDGQPQSTYLEQCYASPKYKRGKWYVLVDKEGTPVSSLITYNLGPGVAGIGSIATPPEKRRRGLATRLIQNVLDLLTKEGVKTTFLFADISPDFYEKLGFKKLPDQFQRYPDSTCMARGMAVAELTNDPNFSVPAYF